jgi:hypothetical protein
MNYATLSAAKQVIGIEPDKTKDDASLLAFLAWATAFIENYKARHYDPRKEVRLFDVPSTHGSMFGVYEPRYIAPAAVPVLRMDDDLLELATLTNGDGDEITDYFLEPANAWPKMRIRLANGDVWRPDASGETHQVIEVDGVWGSHDRYPVAWQTSGVILPDALAADTTTIDLTAIGTLQAGQLLRIDDEFILLAAIDAGTEETVTYTLTIERGAQGTTAATHAEDAPVKIWQVQGNISQACIRVVKWRYSQKDVDNFDRVYSAETGIISIPSSIPSDVLALLGARKITL